MNLTAFVFSFITFLVAHNCFKNRIIKADPQVRVFFLFLSILTFVYAFLAPAILVIFGLSETLPNFAHTGLASLLLTISFAVAKVVWLSLGERLSKEKVGGKSDFSRMSFLALGFLVLSVIVPSASSVKLYLVTIMLVPSLCSLYVNAKKSQHWVFVLTLHTACILVALSDPWYLGSKERLILITVFPIIVRGMMVYEVKLNMRWSVVALLTFVVFSAASFVVTAQRSAQDLATVEVSPETVALRLTGVINRLAVIDTAGALVKNEYADSPIRPTLPIWSVAGSVFSIVPATFDRPNHPRELLKVAGYITSTDEVNLAGTIPGHLLWSFGFIAVVPALIFFWSLVWVLILVARCLPPLFSQLCLYSIITASLRFEATANSFLGSIFASVVFYLVLSLVFLALKRATRPAALTLRA